MNPCLEPQITVNGRTLTRVQAMTLRVAISTFDCDCGSDAHGKAMTEAYSTAKGEIFQMIVEGASGEPARERVG